MGGGDRPGDVCALIGRSVDLGSRRHVGSGVAVVVLRGRVHGRPRADHVAAGAREPMDGARRILNRAGGAGQPIGSSSTLSWKLTMPPSLTSVAVTVTP